jgi:hypothetical protein
LTPEQNWYWTDAGVSDMLVLEREFEGDRLLEATIGPAWEPVLGIQEMDLR